MAATEDCRYCGARSVPVEQSRISLEWMCGDCLDREEGEANA